MEGTWNEIDHSRPPALPRLRTCCSRDLRRWFSSRSARVDTRSARVSSIILALCRSPRSRVARSCPGQCLPAWSRGSPRWSLASSAHTVSPAWLPLAPSRLSDRPPPLLPPRLRGRLGGRSPDRLSRPSRPSRLPGLPVALPIELCWWSPRRSCDPSYPSYPSYPSCPSCSSLCCRRRPAAAGTLRLAGLGGRSSSR